MHAFSIRPPPLFAPAQTATVSACGNVFYFKEQSFALWTCRSCGQRGFLRDASLAKEFHPAHNRLDSAFLTVHMTTRPATVTFSFGNLTAKNPVLHPSGVFRRKTYPKTIRIIGKRCSSTLSNHNQN